MDVYHFTVKNLKGTANRLQEFKRGQVMYKRKKKGFQRTVKFLGTPVYIFLLVVEQN